MFLTRVCTSPHKVDNYSNTTTKKTNIVRKEQKAMSFMIVKKTAKSYDMQVTVYKI